MMNQARDIINEFWLILGLLGQCILSIQQDIKSVNCTTPQNDILAASVKQKIDLLQECMASVQRIIKHLKDRCKNQMVTVDHGQSSTQHSGNSSHESLQHWARFVLLFGSSWTIAHMVDWCSYLPNESLLNKALISGHHQHLGNSWSFNKKPMWNVKKCLEK